MIKVIDSGDCIVVKNHCDEVLYKGIKITPHDLVMILQNLGLHAEQVSPNYDPLDE